MASPELVIPNPVFGESLGYLITLWLVFVRLPQANYKNKTG